MRLLTHRRSAALAGVVATFAALSVGEVAAGAVRSWLSPVESVALSIIDLVPGPIERWAIATLGTADKPVLIVSTIVAVLAFGGILGAVARRRPRIAMLGVALLGLAGIAASAFQEGFAAGVPSAITAVVGMPLLGWLVRKAPAADTATVPESAKEGPVMRPGAGDRRAFLGLSGSVALAAVAATAGGRILANRQGLAVEAARQDIADQIAGATRPSPDGVGSATERALGLVDDPLPPIPDGADFGIDGLAPFVTPAEDFYRIDTALVVPRVDPSTWELRIHGMVDEERTYTYEELLRRDDLFEADITLTCVSNEVGGDLMSSARWTGVSLATLLDEAGADPAATQVVGRSVDDWTAGIPQEVIRDGRDAMVALLMNGEPLPAERGFPARLLVPGIYGYVSATKWLSDIQLTTFEDFDMYWVERGWDAQAPIKLQSRIDVPRPLERVAPGDITVAGVAWAQQVGIQKVEIRVDDGDWQEAELATQVNVDTWRQWRWTWTGAEVGSHRLTVRATDANGQVQIEERQPPFPNGATGWMTLLVTVAEPS